MSHKIATNSALEKIGRNNGHAAPASQDPMDALLHEYDVCSIGESYFKKRREKAKAAMLVALSSTATDKLENTVQNVAKSGVGDTLSIASAQHYSLNAQVKNGASYFDDTAFINSLRRQGVSDDIITAAQKAGYKRRDPTITYTVVISGAE